MSIKAVFFDLGDILFEAHYWRKWMWAYFSKHKDYKGDFKDFYLLYESYIDDIYKANSSYDVMYRQFVIDMNENPDYFIPISYSIKKFFEDNRVLYPGVIETLMKLKKLNILTIIISDNELTESCLRETVLEKFGVNKYIDSVITSYDAKATKPSRVIFNKALEKHDLKMDNVIFVGHDLDEINGANSLGFSVIEYNNYLSYDTKADFKITDFKEIIEIIKYND